jgi:uncharacterized membrane protein YraQ (UPF0718 family)
MSASPPVITVHQGPVHGPVRLTGTGEVEGGDRRRRRLVQAALVASAALWLADFVYKLVADISVANRELCVLYRALPPLGFAIFEYVAETVVIVLLGTFAAVLLGRWFVRLRRFIPRRPASAFACAALIPVCSCAAIPMVATLENRLRFRTTMAFVLAAPLLSPHIVVLSFSMLGPTYGVLRIVSSFALVMATAYLIGWLHDRGRAPRYGELARGCDADCAPRRADVFLETAAIWRRILPYLLIAGALGVGLETLGPRLVMLEQAASHSFGGMLVMILLGVPLYFCNGSEVLFLRPLVAHGLPIGTAIAFSLTSTAVCTTSVAMLARFMGVRLTAVLVACVLVGSVLLALLINRLV